jgi:RsiW-degrading membrane proteinase PrsW (M82 family)
MIKRETPSPISWLQALLPMGLGMASLSVSFYVLVGLAAFIGWLGFKAGDVSAFVRSMYLAFMMAGGPEELTKFAAMAISIFLFRKKIRNVYEYILIGAAVGIGFTLPEEFGYGDVEAQAIWFRMLTVAGHMIYGIIMGGFIGLAQHKKKIGQPHFLQYVLAVCVPVLLHTLYDACTSNNLMMLSEETAESDTGIMLGLIAVAAHFIIQIVVLVLLKKNTEKYCEMALL